MAALLSFEEIKGGRYLHWVAGMLPASALRQDAVRKIFAIVLASNKKNCILSETWLQIFEFCISVIKKKQGLMRARPRQLGKPAVLHYSPLRGGHHGSHLLPPPGLLVCWC